MSKQDTCHSNPQTMYILMTGVWLKVLTTDSETRLLSIDVRLAVYPEANF